MEQMAIAVLMLFPTLFALFLFIGGLVMISLRLSHYWPAHPATQHLATVALPVSNRRTGEYHRHVNSQGGQQAA